MKQASFFLVTEERYKKTCGEQVRERQWYSVFARGEVAEIIESKISEGSSIAVEGKLCYRKFDDDKGKKIFKPRSSLENF